MKRRPGLVGLYFLTAIRPEPPRRSRSSGPRAAARWPSSSSGGRRCEHAAALRLGGHLDHVDALDLDAEELLDGLAHLRLVGVLVHLERVLAVGETGVALLGHDRGDEHVGGVHDAFPSTSGSAASLTSTERAQTIGATSSSDGTVTSTRSRLRNDLIRPISSSCATTTSGVSLPHFSTSALACLVDGVSNAVAVDERERLVADVVRERAGERGAADLAVHLDVEAAHARRERDAAAREVRGADRALAGAAGALLAPRLGAAAGDEPAGLGATGARAMRVQLRAHDLVHDVPLELGAEDGCLERGALGGRAAENLCLQRSHQSVLLISTMPLFGPGTAPLTSSRLRSTSTWWTTSPSWVTRTPPMRPDIFCPRNTRDGVAEAPIEPGVRTLCEPWRDGAALEVVPLDRAGEALADRRARDLDLVAGLERLDGDRVADARARCRRGTRRGDGGRSCRPSSDGRARPS